MACIQSGGQLKNETGDVERPAESSGKFCVLTKSEPIRFEDQLSEKMLAVMLLKVEYSNCLVHALAAERPTGGEHL